LELSQRRRGHEIDDVAPAARLEVRVAGDHEAKRGEWPGLDAAHERRIIEREQRTEGTVVGIVDQDIDAAELRRGARNATRDVLGLEDVAGERERPATALRDARAGCCHLRFGAAGGDHGCTGGGERERDSLADALAGAGDQRHLAGQLSHWPCPREPAGAARAQASAR
jgi:hypothetical protein